MKVAMKYSNTMGSLNSIDQIHRANIKRLQDKEKSIQKPKNPKMN